MSKLIKFIFGIISFIIIVIIILFLILLIKHDFKIKEIFSISESKELIEEYEFDNEKDINIKVNTGNVYIRKSEDNKYRIQLYSENLDNKKIVEENNQISILLKENELNSFKRLFNKVGAIYVYLPNDFESKIKIDANLSNIKVDEYAFSSLDINLDVGDIDVKEIKDLKIKNNVGDIDIHKVNSYLDIDVDTGDVLLDEVILKEDSSIVVNVGKVEIDKANNLYIEAKTNVGKANINNNNKNSDVTLKIRVDVGEIEVNNIKEEIEIKYLKDFDLYKKINIDKVTSLDITKYQEGGDNKETITTKDEILKYYNMIGNTKIGSETQRACEDNTTVYTFNMGNDKVSFEYECNWLVLNNKRYQIIK